MRDLSARLNLRELHSGPDRFWAGQAYIGLSGPGYSRAPARVRTASQPSPPGGVYTSLSATSEGCVAEESEQNQMGVRAEAESRKVPSPISRCPAH